MDRDARREATQEFEATTKRAEGEFQAGLSSLMRGELDASQQTLDQVAAIRDKVAVTVDENERSALLQKGAAIIRSLRDTDDRATFNPSAVQKTRQFFDGLTRRHMLTETDTFGNERTRELDRDDTPEAFVPKRAEPLPDTVPSVEEYLSWPIDKRHRYAREKPEDYRALLTATDR